MPDNATIAMISVTTGYAPDIIFLFTALSFVAPDKSKTSSQNTGAVVSTYSSRDLTGPSISCMTPTFINLLDTTHSSNVVNIVLLGDKDLVGNKLHVKSTTRRHSTYNHVILYIFIYKYIYIYIITYLYFPKNNHPVLCRSWSPYQKGRFLGDQQLGCHLAPLLEIQHAHAANYNVNVVRLSIKWCQWRGASQQTIACEVSQAPFNSKYL